MGLHLLVLVFLFMLSDKSIQINVRGKIIHEFAIVVVSIDLEYFDLQLGDISDIDM